MSSTIYRTLAGAFTALCVLAQYWLSVHGETLGQAAASSVKFFSFFTILTNILSAAALLVPVVAPRSSLGAFLARPSVRTAITGYIIMVGTVYYLRLRDRVRLLRLHNQRLHHGGDSVVDRQLPDEDRLELIGSRAGAPLHHAPSPARPG